jgi:hypothetical protein
MRELREDGFGAKVRQWNATQLLEHWRERWGEHVNARLADLDITRVSITARWRRKASASSRSTYVMDGSLLQEV